MFDLIKHNIEWVFAGAGLPLAAWLIKKAADAIKRRTGNMHRLETTHDYLRSIYKTYECADHTWEVCTCTSSWPVDLSRINTLRDMKAAAVTFLGPIRPGHAFLGVLWRLLISSQRSSTPFRFFHREHRGMKFVVGHTSVVISDSIDEAPSTSGAEWRNHPELAKLLRDHFRRLCRDAVELPDHISNLLLDRVSKSPNKALTLTELLHYLTNPSDARLQKRLTASFPEERQREVLGMLLSASLPRAGLHYQRVAGEEDRVIFTPVTGTGFELPALRICDTAECNLRCVYCPLHGENFANTVKTLPFGVLERFVPIAKDYGFRHFRFTGGEPLRYSRELLNCIGRLLRDIPNGSVSIATNGTLLAECADAILSEPRIRLKVSLDTLDEKRFIEIVGINSGTFQNILSGLKRVTGHCDVGINTVVTKLNLGDIDSLIDFSIENGFYLKLMDLNWYADQKPPDFWRRHYVPLAPLLVSLKRRFPNSREHRTVGGYGIPMTDLVINDKTFIRVKDCSLGSAYSPFCVKSCRFFPCQEGLYQLTFTADGRLRVCRHREDLAADISQDLLTGSSKAVHQKIDELMDRFYRHASHYDQGEFAPPP